MQEVFRLIERVGPTEASVLLTGESGSGKELAAQVDPRLQRAARRTRSSPSIAAPSPPGLIEAELFGYEKGSFTGAVRAHAGVFERANGGTLLLDEVTEMPLDMQTRLLRVLETRKFYRVGASTEYPSDVRVIAATNRCPLQAVQSRPAARGSVVSAGRISDRSAAAAQPRRRRRAARRAFLGRAQCAGRDAKAAFGARAHDAEAASLARQRARTAELHRARVHPGGPGPRARAADSELGRARRARESAVSNAIVWTFASDRGSTTWSAR